MATISQKKAKKILTDGEIGGKPLTPKQKAFFGARAGGVPVIKPDKKKKKKNNPHNSLIKRKKAAAKKKAAKKKQL
jgi:hypothetical protein